MTWELRQLVTFNPVCVTADTPVDQLIDMAYSMDIHHWPVVDGERGIVGMVSESDMIRSAQLQMTVGESTSHGPGEYSAEPWRPRLVGEIMSSRAVTIEIDAPAQEAIRLLLEHQFHSLPVTENGRLTAIVTTGDFLREYSFGDLPSAQELVSKHVVPIAESVDVSATLDEALGAMFEQEGKFIAISRGSCPVGVASYRELARTRCRETARQLSAGDQTVCTLRPLIADALTFRPGTKMAEAASMFAAQKREGGLVVNQANRMVGMLTIQQILRAML